MLCNDSIKKPESWGYVSNGIRGNSELFKKNYAEKGWYRGTEGYLSDGRCKSFHLM